MPLSENDEVLRDCVRHQARGIRVLSIMGVFAGLGFVPILVFMPVNPGEEGYAIGLGVFAALIVVGSLCLWRWGNQRVRALVDLLVRRPHDIARTGFVEFRMNGVPMHYSLDLTDRTGKLWRMRVPSEAVGRQLLERARS